MIELNQPDSQLTTKKRLGRFLNSLATPSALVTDPAERQKVRFLSTLILVLAGLTAVNIPVRLISGSAFAEPVEFTIYLVVSLTLIVAYLMSRSTHYHWAPLLAIVALTSAIYAAFFLADPPTSSSFLYLVVVVLFASAILSNRDLFLFVAGNVLFLLLGPQVIPAMTYDDQVKVAIGLLIIVTVIILVANQNRNRVAQIQQQELQTVNQELQLFSQSLEERIQERTTDLKLASEVGQIISEIRDLDELLQQAVNVIRARFDLYYTQIYLVDQSKRQLEMRAGTGKVGAELLMQKHVLLIGPQSINGAAAAQKQPIVVADTESSPIFRPNPALPRTRSELAVPIILGEEVLGVLDLQSDQPNALNETNLAAFETIAGQLAVAVTNARLLQSQRQITEELQRFRLGFEQSQNAIFMTDVQGKILYVNPSFTKIYGYTAADAVGNTPRILKSSITSREQYAHFWQTLLNKQTVSWEIVNRRKDGRLIQVMASNTPILNEQDELVGFLSLHADVTAQKQMEEQLAQRVKQLNFLNELGRKADELTEIDAYLHWVVAEMPAAMQYEDECLVAIQLEDRWFGEPDIRAYKRHVVEKLHLAEPHIGYLYLAYTNGHYEFQDADSALMGEVSRRVGGFIEQHLLVQQLANQSHKLQMASEIGTAVAVILNSQHLLEESARRIQKSYHFYQVAIFLLDDVALNLVAAAGQVDTTTPEQAITISLFTQRSMVARTARLRTAQLSNDVRLAEFFMAHTAFPDTQSELVVPMMVGETVLGVIDLQSTERNFFSPSDANIFTTLAAQLAVALQNARQYEESQITLNELSALQHIITSENWEEYIRARESQVQGFVATGADLMPIMSADDDALGAPWREMEHDPSALLLPVRLRGIAVGRLGVRSGDGRAISEDDRQLLEEFVRQVAEALERARLFEETELARMQTNALFSGSERVVRAASITEALVALVESTRLQEMDRVNILFFDHPWEDVMPENMTVTAVWERSGRSALVPVGTSYPMAYYPATKYLSKEDPLVINNVGTDPRMDEVTRNLFMNRLGMNSVMIFPVVVGDQFIGIITAQASNPTQLSLADVRQISSLADQASAVVQTQRLFDQTRVRAQQERVLREVSEKVYGAVDAETIMRTAVQEVGRALGLQAFVYLENKSNGHSEPHEQ